MITFNKSDFDTILEYAKKNLPEEACGLIGGTIENGDKHIKKIYLLTNIDHSNEHFSMDPKEQLAAVKDMRANGLVPLGNWHSHPESPSRPLRFEAVPEYLHRFTGPAGTDAGIEDPLHGHPSGIRRHRSAPKCGLPVQHLLTILP